jgi:hypothetical protein
VVIDFSQQVKIGGAVNASFFYALSFRCHHLRFFFGASI